MNISALQVAVLSAPAGLFVYTLISPSSCTANVRGFECSNLPSSTGVSTKPRCANLVWKTSVTWMWALMPPPPQKKLRTYIFLDFTHVHNIRVVDIVSFRGSSARLIQIFSFRLIRPIFSHVWSTSALGATALGQGLMNIDKEKGSLPWNKFHLFELYCN
jgi:hypothetical protein